jgi:transcriptional regulator with XRE-family HTH domain
VIDYLRGNARCAAGLVSSGMNQQTVGTLLRDWRQRRRLTQMDLALDADISPRHLSFVETGRAQPSREMLLHLSEQLEIPLRERNALLVAGGFAPMYRERGLDDAALAQAREAIELVLAAQRPFPALALDRRWNIAASNDALPELYEGVSPLLLKPPVNALRLSLHPQGVAPRIENLAVWRSHLLGRLRRQVGLTGDPALRALLEEISAYPGDRTEFPDQHAVLVPLVVRTSLGRLSFFSTTTVFGSPVDVTLSEIAIEMFFAADEATAKAVRQTPRS